MKECFKFCSLLKNFFNKATSKKTKKIKKVSEIEVMKLDSKRGTVPNCIQDDTTLYRYFEYYKLKSLLENSSLFFSNAKKNTDNLERQIPDQCYEGYQEETKENLKGTNIVKQKIVKAYLTCWTKAKDSFAFWKLYNPSADGCCICTTFGELKRQLEEKNVAFFDVKYVDPHSTGKRMSLPHAMFQNGCEPRTIIASEMYKTKSYEYEQEIRGVLYSKEDCDGILVDVDLSTLISNVILNPFSTAEATEKVKLLINKYIDHVKYEKSIIDERG